MQKVTFVCESHLNLKDSDTAFKRAVQVKELPEWRQDDGITPKDQERN